MTWQLRRALPRDLDDIMRLETSTFGNDAWSADTMLAELRNDASWYVVAFRPQTPSTIEAYGGVQAPAGSPVADIQTIAVVPESRRGGLGRVIMRTLINEAMKRGAQEVFLEVRADNPGAENLYFSLGFEKIAVRKHYYQPDGVDAHVMRLTTTPREPGLAHPVVPDPAAPDPPEIHASLHIGLAAPESASPLPLLDARGAVSGRAERAESTAQSAQKSAQKSAQASAEGERP